MRIEIEECKRSISLYIGGKFLGTKKKPKNYDDMGKNKIIQLFGKFK